ncbi:MAG: crotonase/enoyl-CoA hydratase family protein [Burkholderia sp.]|nr:crotonase/enoyl-CoA hydratase family protein [Burkholderia sp.]
MATEERVSISLDNGVAQVRLNRPDKMNALDSSMFQALLAAADSLRRDRSVRAVVVAGEGKAFCAGLDMQSFQRMQEGEVVNAEAGFPFDRGLMQRTFGNANAFQQVAMMWRDIPVPVIAAVHGVAFGGGLQIALGADMRFIAADARMSVMEIKWGLVPDMGGILLMRELARHDVVRELTFTGRQFSGEEAVRIGFATRVEADPLAAATAVARQIAQQSPEAVRAAKRLLNLSLHADPATVLQAESYEQERLVGSASQVEAVMANREKRPALFKD